MKNCYCCLDKPFEECCKTFLDGAAKPQTAETLMRSRFSAYATINVDYLLNTTHPSTRRFYDAKSIEQWAKSNSWQKLEIISTEKGLRRDQIGIVEFKAVYLDSEQNQKIHHEVSNFAKELGKWFYVDGKIG